MYGTIPEIELSSNVLKIKRVLAKLSVKLTYIKLFSTLAYESYPRPSPASIRRPNKAWYILYVSNSHCMLGNM